MGNEVIKSGVKACRYSLDGNYKYIMKPGVSVYLQADHVHRFHLDPTDESLFGEQTKNKAATAKGAKWAYLLNSLFTEARKTPPSGTYALWADASSKAAGEFIKTLGIGNQYKEGDFIEFSPKKDNLVWIGHWYRMEVFSHVPDKGLYFNFMVIDKPQIRYTYFDKQVFPDITVPGDVNDGLYHYGQTIPLHMSTHLIPAKFPKEYHFETESSYEDLELEVTLADINQGPISGIDPIIKGELSKYIKSSSEANLSFEIPIFIDPAWKDKIHFKSEGEKGFSAAVKITNKKTGKTYSSHPEFTSLVRISETKRDSESFEVSTFFLVKYESVADILQNFEKDKNSQIQYIGDIKYSKKEYDPCGYSKITVKEDGSSRQFDIFDEDAATIDQTELIFDVVAGDTSKKTVTIELGKLTVKGVMCTGVLLEKGQMHSDMHNVFQMHKVVLPLINDQHKYVVEEDQTHKKQLKSAGTKITPVNEKDYDYKADPTKRSEDVSRRQNFKENRDYSYDGDNLKLTTGFIYNKTFDTQIAKYLGMDDRTFIDDAVDLFWAFRYFFLSQDIGQTYYVPIGTCRYPNQLARIRVFPDIDWKFSLSVGVGGGLNDTYSYTNMPAGDINKNHNDKAQKAVKVRSQLNTTPSPVTFDLKIKRTINKTDSKELAAGYEGKIRSILATLISIKDTIDTLCNTREAKASSVAKMFNTRKPITLKIDYPVISIIGSWKFGESIDAPNKCEVQGSINLGFNPLIKGEGAIDLLACLEIYPVAKLVIKAADLVLASVKGEMWFDIYAYGAVNLNGDIFFNKKEIADFQVDTVMGLGVRLGIKFNATTKKITFEGDKKQDVTLAGGELSGKGETSLKIKAKRGIDREGAFIEAGVDFGGIIVFVTAKARVLDFKVGIEATPYVLVKPKPDILSKRIHIL